MDERTVQVGDKVWVCLDVLGIQQEDELIPGHEPMYVAAGTLRLGWSDDPTSDEFVTTAPYMVQREPPFVPVSPVRADREAIAQVLDEEFRRDKFDDYVVPMAEWRRIADAVLARLAVDTRHEAAS